MLGASSRSGGVGTDDRGLEGGNDVVDARGGSLARALGKGALGAGADDGALRGGADGALRGGADGALRGGAEGALGGAEARPLGAGAEGRPWLAGRGGDELDAGTGVLRPTRAAGGLELTRGAGGLELTGGADGRGRDLSSAEGTGAGFWDAGGWLF